MTRVRKAGSSAADRSRSRVAKVGSTTTRLRGATRRWSRCVPSGLTRMASPRSVGPFFALATVAARAARVAAAASRSGSSSSRRKGIQGQALQRGAVTGQQVLGRGCGHQHRHAHRMPLSGQHGHVRRCWQPQLGLRDGRSWGGLRHGSSGVGARGLPRPPKWPPVPVRCRIGRADDHRVVGYSPLDEDHNMHFGSWIERENLHFTRCAGHDRCTIIRESTYWK